VLWRAEQAVTGAGLDDAPALHHRDAVRDMAHHGQIMRDEQGGEPARALQVEDQAEHLRPHRPVERGNRLVPEDQCRIERQRPGDADTLALATGELGRIGPGIGGVEPDQNKKPAYDLGCLRRVALP